MEEVRLIELLEDFNRKLDTIMRNGNWTKPVSDEEKKKYIEYVKKKLGIDG